MQVQIKVSNIKKALKQLKTLQKDLEPDFQEIVKGGAQLIRGEAIKSIQSGAKSGIVYEKYNPRRTHTSSSQGQAPASDTGFLASNIAFNVKEGGMVAEVESKAKYSKFLEFGTQNMKARPFMFPALEENKPRIRRMFATTKGKAK